MKEKILEKLDRMNRTMSIHDVMKHTGVSRQTIYSWIDKGLQRTKNEDRELRFSMTEVDQFLAEKRNERRLLDPKHRKAVRTDGELFQKLLDRAPGKQHIKIVDGVIQRGLERFDSEKMKPFGGSEKMVRIEKELYKKLLLMSVDLEVPVYKVLNIVISLGLDNSSSDQ